MKGFFSRELSDMSNTDNSPGMGFLGKPWIYSSSSVVDRLLVSQTTMLETGLVFMATAELAKGMGIEQVKCHSACCSCRDSVLFLE